MELPEKFAQISVSQILSEHPQIGTMLEKHQVDCVTCASSSCLLKNIIGQHIYDPKRAIQLEQEINDYLNGLPT